MKVLHVARECAPLAKAGGLADVVGALPLAASRVEGGAEGSVLLPLYDPLRSVEGPLRSGDGEPVLRATVRVGARREPFTIFRAPASSHDVPLYLADAACFAGPSPYGGDDLLREAVLSAAALELGPRFDVVHVHDHHAALACVGLAGHPPPRPTVLTVHNARYHGALGWQAVETLDLPADLDRGRCDHGAAFNRLKAALLHARVVSTVSPTHARDLVGHPEASGGLDYAFRAVGDRLVGILNGIDQATWNPATDPHLEARYSREDLAGKSAQKRLTCEGLGLRGDGPLLAFVGRLVPEKGVDAMLGALPGLVAEHPSVQAALLGTGEPRYEEGLRDLAAAHPGRIAVAMMHDERFAHRLYAAADILLMPSWHEPCGLSQMYAMRYGTIPVVYPTGGLRDSVVPFDAASGTGTGAWMETPDAAGLAGAVRRALGWMSDRSAWSRVRDNAMAADHGWSASAARHVATWRRALEVR